MSDNQSLEGSWSRLSQVAVKGAQYNSPERHPHPKCLEGTRVDLLKYIYGFLDDSEKNHLIWLHGTVGVGKSSVAFTVAEKMRELKVTEETDIEKRLGGTFFFSREKTERRAAGYFFATLVYQLATNFPSIRKDVSRVIRDNPALLDPNTPLRDQMEALFLKPLRLLRLRLRGCPPLSFVVDALDECTSKSELSDLILSLARALRDPDLPVTHILFTSRSESYISEVFQNDEVRPLVREIPVKTSGEGVATIISLDGADVDNDIYIFLQHSFRELQCRHPDFPQPSGRDLAKLASRAGRRFIVASTMMKFIIDDEDNDPRDRLQLMLDLTSELLPGTEVYKLYDLILSTCADPKRAYLHLSLVAALTDPLPISQISTLLGPGLGRDVQTTLIQLRSVIDIPTDSTLPVNIYHSSIRDYVSDPSNCSLRQVRDIASPHPHALLAHSSLRLMMAIPQSTALLDALSELKKQSKAMEPKDPYMLKDSLAFLVQPPEPLSAVSCMLWLRGDRALDLQSWLRTVDGHAWLRTEGGRDWLQTRGRQDWLQTPGGRDWLQTEGGQDWLQTEGGQDWLQTEGGQDWLPTQGGQNWLWTQEGRDWLTTLGGRQWVQIQVRRRWPTTQIEWWVPFEREPGWAPPEREPEWAPFEREPEWAPFKREPEWTPFEREPEWAPFEREPEWAPFEREPEWAPFEREPEWAPPEREPEWVPSERAPEWVPSERAPEQAPPESEPERVPPKKMLLTRLLEWSPIQRGRGRLQTSEGQEWLQTPEGRQWLQTRRGQEWLQTPEGLQWLQTLGGRQWLHAVEGQLWLQTRRGREWLQTLRGRGWLQTWEGGQWLQTWGGREWLQTRMGREWLQTPEGREWLQTPEGLKWLQTPEGLQTQEGQQWLQTQRGQQWLQTPEGLKWLQTPEGLQTHEGRQWLQTWRGRQWLQTPEGLKWLQTPEGLQTHEGRQWLQTWKGQQWLQTPEGLKWLQTPEGLQTQEGRQWLQTRRGQQWLQTQAGRDWLRTQAGRQWLQTRAGRDWLETQAGRDWLQTQAGRDWLQIQAGDWLQTQAGRDWLQTQAGRDWLQTQAGRDWLQTQAGRDWLQTPHGQSWQSTPAASVWVTMEEFLTTSEAVNEYIITGDTPVLPAFQVIQQFKTLPDFLMFPVFLALRHRHHSTSATPESVFLPNREIIHTIYAFESFANEALERSRTASDALKYACHNWAVHLSHAPNPWDDTFNHIFQAFWNDHMIPWIEMEWCLKGLRSCLVILSEGQKVVKSRT